LNTSILILANSPRGLYNFRKELIEALINNGDRVIISSPYGENIREFEEIGCEYSKIEFNRHGINIVNEIKLFNYYKHIIKTFRPDIILSYTIKPNIYGALAARHYDNPVIANVTGLGTALENPGLLKKTIIELYKKAFSETRTVFFQNNYNRQFFVDNNIALGKHKILPGSGVNLDHYYPIEYPLSDRIVEFVFISRIMKDKGIDEFLKAAEFIKKKFPNTKFHVCGVYEEEYGKILSDYENRNIIIYHGMVKDIRDILTITHCTINPSYHEGMSNVLLESAASARPILASDIPGCKETFDENISGFSFNKKDSSSLIKAIEKFLALSYKEKKEMGNAGRRKIEDEFDRQIVVDAYMSEINNILEDK